MTIWCAGLDGSLIQTCTPNGHPYRVTYARCPIDTINSPDDGHMAARIMHRLEINIHEKELCVKLVIYKDVPYRLSSKYALIIHNHNYTSVITLYNG